MPNIFDAASPTGIWVADDNIGVSGTLVALWNSRAGVPDIAEGILEVTDGNKPIIAENAINSKKALTFGGTSSKLSRSPCDYANKVSGVTYYAVFKLNGLGVVQNVIGHSTETNNNGVFFGINSTNVLRLFARRVPTDAAVTVLGTTVLTTGVWYVIAATVNYATGAMQMWLNGVSEGTGTLTSTGTTNGKAGRISIGCEPASNVSFLNGQVAMGSIFEEVHSAADRNDVYSWIQDYYGITLPGYIAPTTKTKSGPTSDYYKVGWSAHDGSTADLYTHIDETVASSTDFIKSTLSATPQYLEEKLPAMVDPNLSTNHVLSYMLSVANSPSNTVRVSLMEGETEIAFWIHSNLTSTDQTFTQTLTNTQADSIVDYSNLRFKITASTP